MTATLNRHVLGLALCALLLLFVAAPALAVDGRTAVGMCIDSTASGARCSWSVNGQGEIDICNKNGCVHCESATSECTMARTGPRPTGAFPAGTEIRTAVGSFRISAKPTSKGMDGLIKPVVHAKRQL